MSLDFIMVYKNIVMFWTSSYSSKLENLMKNWQYNLKKGLKTLYFLGE